MIAWLALALAVCELVLLVALVAGATVAYRKVKPTVSPFLSMLAPYTGAESSSSGSASLPAEPSSRTGTGDEPA